MRFVNNTVGDIMYNKMFSRRAAICFFVITFLLLSCILRIAVIAVGNYGVVQNEQSNYKITLKGNRGTIYDCKERAITNNETAIIAAISPTPQAITCISTLLSGDRLDTVLSDLKDGKPTVCEVPREIACDGIAYTKIYKNTLDGKFLCHAIGYTDNVGHGVSGLQYYYDELLYNEKGTSAHFTVSGKGDVLSGIEPYFISSPKAISSGVVTTLDIDIQSVAEQAAVGLTAGAVLVADAKNGKIRAMVSMPQYDINAVEKSLDAENSPLINRSIMAFSVGSVFKPCVAAAAIECGMSDFCFNCVGKTHIIDREFNCHKRDGHGLMDLRMALANSCNCYFYNFAIKIGGEKLYKMASSAGFGSEIEIAQNMSVASGSITARKKLTNDAFLANLSIGQGDLSASPVAMLQLYCAIANDGTYKTPSLIEKTINNGKGETYQASAPTRIMSEKTVRILRDCLVSVVTDGTGTDAAPTLCTAAGKTATAQTGRFNEKGVEITNSWFCGFFPAEEPRYVVIVMSDGTAQKSTARIFSEIADGVTKLFMN